MPRQFAELCLGYQSVFRHRAFFHLHGQLQKAVEGGPFAVKEVRKKTRRRQAPPPFTTSKLQQEAAKALRMPSYKTMMVAQSLYEGVELPDAGLVGLITYMRTDSVRVADEAVAAAREYIRAAHGDAYVPEPPNTYRNSRTNITGCTSSKMKTVGTRASVRRFRPVSSRPPRSSVHWATWASGVETVRPRERSSPRSWPTRTPGIMIVC